MSYPAGYKEGYYVKTKKKKEEGAKKSHGIGRSSIPFRFDNRPKIVLVELHG